MKRLLLSSLGATLCLVYASFAGEAETILEESGIRGGLVLHLGCGGGELTGALGGSERYQVHGLAVTVEDLAAARQRLTAAGVYGRISADRLESANLPFVDNLINLVVADDLAGVPMAEIQRVLCPNGVAMIKRPDGSYEKTVKAWPKSIDEWTHYFHGSVATRWRRTRWSARRRGCSGSAARAGRATTTAWRSMSALVTGGGRMFYIMDEGSRVSIQLPSQWKLIARDAFNGAVLWKQADREVAQPALAAEERADPAGAAACRVGGRVFVTMSIARAGRAASTRDRRDAGRYRGNRAAEEMVLCDGVLYVVVTRGGSGSSRTLQAETTTPATRGGSPRSSPGMPNPASSMPSMPRPAS